LSGRALAETRPSIAAWGNGKVAIVTERDLDGSDDAGGSGKVLYRTNRTGRWTGHRLTYGNHDHLPAIAVNLHGDPVVVFERGDEHATLRFIRLH
jgi:hypothetical protein